MLSKKFARPIIADLKVSYCVAFIYLIPVLLNILCACYLLNSKFNVTSFSYIIFLAFAFSSFLILLICLYCIQRYSLLSSAKSVKSVTLNKNRITLRYNNLDEVHGKIISCFNIWKLFSYKYICENNDPKLNHETIQKFHLFVFALENHRYLETQIFQHFYALRHTQK